MKTSLPFLGAVKPLLASGPAVNAPQTARAPTLGARLIRKRGLILWLAGALLATSGLAQSSNSPQHTATAFASGGGTGSGGGYTFVFSMGESMAGSAAGGGYTLAAGFLAQETTESGNDLMVATTTLLVPPNWQVPALLVALWTRRPTGAWMLSSTLLAVAVPWLLTVRAN